MFTALPSVLSEPVSEYKRNSFRLNDEKVVLNWVTKEKYLNIDEVKSISLILKKGIWHYTMSPFVRHYVNFAGSDSGIDVGIYSLARCYTLLFYHSDFKLENLPSDLSVPNFSPQTKNAFVTSLTLCTENGTPLFNTAFSTGSGGLDTIVVPSSNLYRHVDGDCLLIPVAEVNPYDRTLPYLLEDIMDKKLKKELEKLVQGDLGGAHTYGFPKIEEFQIKAKEAKRVGLPTLGQDKISLYGGYDENTGTKISFAIRTDSDHDLDEKEYPILQKLAMVLSHFHMKNLRHDKVFDAEYRKRLIKGEKDGEDRYYNNNSMKGENDSDGMEDNHKTMSEDDEYNNAIFAPNAPDVIRATNDTEKLLSYLLWMEVDISRYRDLPPETLQTIMLEERQKFLLRYKPVNDDMKGIITDIPVEIKTFTIGKQIGSAGYSKLYEAYPVMSKYVVKIMPIDKPGATSGPYCLTSRERAQRELTIALKMSDLNIGPKVHEIAMGENEASMVMDRYDDTLENMYTQQKARATPTEYKNFEEAYMKRARELITAMHIVGVVHGDVAMNNILYRTKGAGGQPDIRLSDFGLSMFSIDPALQARDFAMLDGSYWKGGFKQRVYYQRNGRPCLEYM